MAGDKYDKLLDAIRATYLKLGEQIKELNNAVNEEPTDGQLAKRMIEDFRVSWSARHGGEKYVVTNWAASIVQMRKLVKALEPADLAHRITAYLASHDPYYVNARHPLAIFMSNVNKFGKAVSKPQPGDDDDFLQAPVLDCRHVPRCTSDQQHTKKRAAEARA